MPTPIVCIGGAVLDRTFTCTHEPALGTSNPVTCRNTFGGVARNVAESLARLGAHVRLISAVGNDAPGHELVKAMQTAGVDIGDVHIVDGQPTAEYIAALWHGELFAGFANMAVFDALLPERIAPHLAVLPAGSLLLADCNLPSAMLSMLCARANKDDGFHLILDAVSLAKSERLPARLDAVEVLFLNTAQARHLTATRDLDQALDRLLARGCGAIVMTSGRDGLTLAQDSTRARFPALPVPVASVTGAGDAVIAGTLLGLSEGRTLPHSIPLGLALASLTLQTFETVPANLSRARLDSALAAYTHSTGSSHAR